MNNERRVPAAAAALAVSILALGGCAAFQPRYSCKPPAGLVPVEGRDWEPVTVYSIRARGADRGGARFDVRCIPWAEEPVVPVVVSVNSRGRLLCRQWFVLPLDANRPGAMAVPTETPVADKRRPQRFAAPATPACVIEPADVVGGCDSSHQCTYRFKVRVVSSQWGAERGIAVPPQDVTFDAHFTRPHKLPPGAKGGYRCCAF